MSELTDYIETELVLRDYGGSFSGIKELSVAELCVLKGLAEIELIKKLANGSSS